MVQARGEAGGGSVASGVQCPVRGAARLRQREFQERQEIGEIERLGHRLQREAPDLLRPARIGVDPGIRRAQDHGHLPHQRILAEGVQKWPAGGRVPGEEQIMDDEIRSQLADGCQMLDRSGTGDPVALLLQDLAEQRPDIRGVIDKKDMRGTLCRFHDVDIMP